MPAKLGLAHPGAQFREEWLDLTECRHDLAVRRKECRPIDGTRGDQRRSHIPIADHHAEGSVLVTADDRAEFLVGLGIEFAEVSGASVGIED